MAEPHIPVRRESLSCRICNEVLRNPATIPCGHNFCMLCIQDSWDNEERNSYCCSCPECYRTFSPRPYLIRNTTLADLVKDTERCKGGAGSERKQHCSTGRAGEPQSLKRSWTPTVRGTSENNMCWKHNSPLEVYCCTDEQIICAVCASAEHTGHRTERVSEERRRKQEELKDIKKKSKHTLQTQEKEWKNVRETLKQIQEGAREAEDHCESVVAALIDSLQRHYGSVRELIEAQERAAAAQVQSSLHNLELKMEGIKQRDAELDRLSLADNDVHFLQKWPSLCENDTFHEVSEGQLLPFEAIKRAVDQLGTQLEAFCDKEFAAISQTDFSTVTSTHTGQTVEPQTRAEFLEYACELSLDPNTAHEDLVLSHRDKEVRLYPQTRRDPAARHPERFIHRRQVLCREGLQAERCYYEVEVHGDKAEVALAYKGLDRKSRTSLSAFGGNAKSWSLDRSRTYSVSHRSDGIQLTTAPSHHRIGVYLKFKEGTMIFYEVSDSMKFLYKVETTFTEPLYPGFWLGEKCCIRLCDLRQEGL
ncbi:tripartite motif-containing protein 16-like protein [Centroberyx affinis]|uniref:tripartite motif-containing protein 16-like protein n=1 Tax=Centroberyx affinis TaxID=166261 RepID=UPI003A5C7324